MNFSWWCGTIERDRACSVGALQHAGLFPSGRGKRKTQARGRCASGRKSE